MASMRGQSHSLKPNPGSLAGVCVKVGSNCVFGMPSPHRSTLSFACDKRSILDLLRELY